MRYGILVNEDTEEAIVEVYLKEVCILPLPSTLFKINQVKTVLISRRERLKQLSLKLRRVLSSHLYLNLKINDILVTELRMWKSLSGKLEEIDAYDKKLKNSSQIRVNAMPLNASKEDEDKVIEDTNIAEEDIIIIEIPNAKTKKYVFCPM